MREGYIIYGTFTWSKHMEGANIECLSLFICLITHVLC